MRTEFNALKDRLNTANIYDEKTSDCIYNDTMKLVSELEKKINDTERGSRTNAYVFVSSWGNVCVNEYGYIIEMNAEPEINGEANYLFDIDRFDINEYGEFCVRNNITNGEAEDVLLIGFWKKDGTYTPADKKFRKEIYHDDEPPTELCKDKDKYVQVKDIIAKLKAIEVDGETMEHILVEVGMEGQMLTQLIRGAVHLDLIEELINDEKEKRK